MTEKLFESALRIALPCAALIGALTGYLLSGIRNFEPSDRKREQESIAK